MEAVIWVVVQLGIYLFGVIVRGNHHRTANRRRIAGSNGNRAVR